MPHQSILNEGDQAQCLRIYLGESDRHDGRPLYEAIVLKAREHHLAGATVVRGPMGYGHTSRLHTTKILQLSNDLPMIIEIVDSVGRIQSFLPTLKKMMSGGLITTNDVTIHHYTASDASPEEAS